MYVPVHIDGTIESQIRTTPFQRALRRIIRYLIGVYHYYSFPYGRQSVYSQIKDRPEFAAEEWLSRNPLRLDDIKVIVSIIRDELEWPNCHFIPGDPVPLLLVSARDDFPWSWLYHALRQKFPISATCQELGERVWREKWNLGMLVDYLLAEDREAESA